MEEEARQMRNLPFCLRGWFNASDTPKYDCPLNAAILNDMQDQYLTEQSKS
jgi:hypothetical protein